MSEVKMEKLDMDKLIEDFRTANVELVKVQQRFEQLQNVLQQVEQERAQLRLQAQYLTGRLETLAGIIPEETRQEVIEALQLEMQQAAAAQQAVQQQGAPPAPLREIDQPTEE